MLKFILLIVTIIGMFIIKKIKIVDKPFIRFVAVGVFNTLTYFIFFTIINTVLLYLVAHILGFLISAFISFFVTTIYTFESNITIEKAVKFPLTFLPNLIFSTFGTLIIVQLGLLSEDIASLIMMLIAVPITFIVAKVVITGKQKFS